MVQKEVMIIVLIHREYCNYKYKDQRAIHQHVYTTTVTEDVDGNKGGIITEPITSRPPSAKDCEGNLQT
jgi:Cu2+-containing amine oxidase